jgi:hypothetical protein
MADPCRTATAYADRMSKCKTLDELRSVWSEINCNKKDIDGWYEWLIDIKDSNKIRLTGPDVKIEDILNDEGLKALKNLK